MKDRFQSPRRFSQPMHTFIPTNRRHRRSEGLEAHQHHRTNQHRETSLPNIDFSTLFSKNSPEQFQILLTQLTEIKLLPVKSTRIILAELTRWVKKNRALAVETQHIMSGIGSFLVQQIASWQAEEFFELQTSDGQLLAFIVYNLGILSQSSLKIPSLSGAIITKLATAMEHSSNLSAKAITNFFYGSGLLAKEGCLNQTKIEHSVLQLLLQRLKDTVPLGAYDISLSLYGFGLAAHKLDGPIDVSVVQTLLQTLNNKNSSANFCRNVANSLYGLGLSAEKLNDSLDVHIVQNLLQELNNKNSSENFSRNIANSLYGLGLSAPKLNGLLDAQLIQSLLHQLKNKNSSQKVSKDIANSLYGVGLVAQKLNGFIESQLVQSLLQELIDMNAIHKDIQSFSNSFYALGLMASKLTGSIESQLVQSLLQELIDMNSIHIDVQSISTSFYALGLMVPKLTGPINSQLIQVLLEQLNNGEELKSLDISTILRAIGLCRQAKQLQGRVKTSIIEELLSKVEAESLTSSQARFWVHTLTLLDQPETQYPYFKPLLARSLTTFYLHPTQAAKLLNGLTIYKAYAKELNAEFKTLLRHLPFSVTRFPLHLQEQLQQNYRDLAVIPAWQRALGRQLQLGNERMAVISRQTTDEADLGANVGAVRVRKRPHADAIAPRRVAARTSAAEENASKRPRCAETHRDSEMQWQQAYRNTLFKAIADKNLPNLQALLQIKTDFTRQRHESSRASSQQAMVHLKVSKEKYASNEANRLVEDFFNNIPAEALRRLISQSSHEYFTTLLHACTVHERFHLAQTHRFHPILLYLDVNELIVFINNLLGSLQLYRDHKALLCVVDALMIRIDHHPEEQTSVINLQKQLLKTSIDFHEKCRHKHVVSFLRCKISEVVSCSLQLLDEEETPFAVDSSRANPLTQPPQQCAVAAPANELNLQANDRWHYYDSDIQAILSCRVNSYLNVHVLASAQMNAYVPGNGVAQVVDLFLQNFSHRAEQILLIPIQVGEHWVGLHLTVQDKQIVRGLYFNSQQGTGDNERINLITHELIETRWAAPDLKITVPGIVMQQRDNTSCGPVMIENLYCHIKNNWWTKDGAISARVTQTIRHRHLEILRVNRPDYFRIFQRRQEANDEAFPSMTTQMLSHGIFSPATTSRQRTLPPNSSNFHI